MFKDRNSQYEVSEVSAVSEVDQRVKRHNTNTNSNDLVTSSIVSITRRVYNLSSIIVNIIFQRKILNIEL